MHKIKNYIANRRNSMRKNSRRMISLVMCFLCTAALTACQQSGIFTNNDENGNAYTLSDQITLSSTVLRSVNPITSQDNDFYHISKLVYDSLVELDDTLAPQPSLASDWSVDQASRSVTFTLKSGVKFSDGSSLSAKDVVFSFNACKDAGTSPYKHNVQYITKAEASGDSKVTFRFSSATNISLADFVFPIVSSSQFSSKKAFLDDTEEAVVGTGRYMITSVDLKQQLKLEANPNYYGQKPTNTVKVSVSPIETQYVGFVESGELSMIIETAPDRDDVSGNSKLSVTDFTSNEFETLGFNCASGACADPALRRAIAYIIDRDEIKGAAYYNYGTKSDDLYYPGYYGTEIKNMYAPDKDKVNDNLKTAGYSDTDGDSMLENADGAELTLKLAVNTDNLSRKTAAQLVASELLEYGINVTISEVASESFTSAITSGSYDMFIGGWKVTEDYDLRSFYHSSYGNPARYSNATLDGYLDEMQSGLDAENMTATLEKAKKILEDEVPYLCLMYKTYSVVSTADLEGIVAPRFDDYYYACDDWKIRIYKEDDTADQQDATLADGTDGNSQQ